MPTRNLIKGSPELVLAPDDVESPVRTFKTTLLTVGIADKTGPAATWVAEQAIAVAKLGGRGPFQINELIAASYRT